MDTNKKEPRDTKNCESALSKYARIYLIAKCLANFKGKTKEKDTK